MTPAFNSLGRMFFLFGRLAYRAAAPGDNLAGLITKIRWKIGGITSYQYR